MSIRRRNAKRFRQRLAVESLEVRTLLTAAPLEISEFMASNDDTLNDGDGNSSDWIEIHNPTNAAVDLDGWFLSDDADRLDKWAFPSEQLEPGAYKIIFASGQANEQYVDGAGNLHTGFRLNKSGEYLGLSYRDPDDGLLAVSEFAPEYPPQFEDVSYGAAISFETEELIASDAEASYLVPSNDAVDEVWTDVDFDDSSWASGPTGIGYENAPADYASLLKTTVPLGTDSAYVRLDFQAQNVDEFDSLTLRVKYDDGFVAHLNGEPLPGVRRNAPNSVSYLSVATGNHPDADAVRFVDFDLTNQLGLLRDGLNVLAIHALNQASSSDMLILPELVATRSATGTDLSQGFFTSPTPGQSNSTGIANPGPIIRDVTTNPGALADDADLVVTAHVTQLEDAISAVALHYRVDYGNEVSLSMVDDGSGPDAVADDDIFSALIPASASGPREMVRWYVTATDTGESNSRDPAFLDSTGNGQSPEYHGTVIENSFTTELPVFQWFTENKSASNTRSGTRASVFYADRFYDNVFVRQRGGATNGSQSQKFDFNRDHDLFVNDELGSVGEINMNGNGSDGSYLRQPMGFDIHTATGGAASASFFTAMYANGQFDRVGIWVEQVDADFLERQGYDRQGDLYKLVQRSNLDPAVGDISTGVEKKTNEETGLTSFASLVSGVEGRTEAQRQEYIRDHLDIAQVLNYMAVRTLQHQADDVRKNVYLYNDIAGDQLWRIYPWDLDWTFNIVGGHDNQDSQRTEHPFWGVQDFPTADGNNQWNKLYEALFETTEIQQMFLRRVRTLMDEYYGGLTGDSSWFTDYVNQQFPKIDAHVGSSTTSAKNSLLRSIEDRRNELYDQYTRNIPGYSVVIPEEQPERPTVDFGAIDFNPASGNQDEEYIELTNPNEFAVDISGWQLDGGVSHLFQPGTVIAPGGSLFVTASVADFRDRATGPRGGQGLFVQQWNSGHLSNFSEPVELIAPDGFQVDALTYEGTPTTNQLHLRISELHYHPEAQAGDLTSDTRKFEFVELINTNSQPIDVAGVYFSKGIDFQFPDQPVILAPNEIVLIVADQVAFSSRYGDGADFGGFRIIGEFQNGSALANDGERIKLEDSDGSTILDFSYDDAAPWATGADGDGSSLAIHYWKAGADASPDYNDPENWLDAAPSPGDYVFVDVFPALAGDANNDGEVSFTDFLILSANFGQQVQTFEQGDFDGNGSVDFVDFLILAENFGKRN